MTPDPLAPPPPLQAALPQVTVSVVGPQQLRIESNIPSPGGWAQITAILLAAAQTAHEEEVKEAQQAGQAARIVVPQGVRVG